MSFATAPVRNKICPRCQCSTVFRSRRRLYDLPMAFFGLKPKRCTSCGLRYYNRGARTPPSTRSSALRRP